MVDYRVETPTARTVVLDVPGWPGHLPGQHVDVRLTAEDGYSTQRSYTIAAPADGDRVELTVQRVTNGEASPYLTEVLSIGHPVEIRSPVGGWFVWHPTDTQPVLLVAGGSGIVPLIAMIRARRAAAARVPFRLVYWVRAPDEQYCAAELRSLGRAGDSLDVAYNTRAAPEGWPRPPGRIGADDLTAHGWRADVAPSCFVCGPTGFVEAVANILIDLGHDPRRINTERFGPTGG